MKNILIAGLILFNGNAFTSCTKQVDGIVQASEIAALKTAGVVSGKITDSKGNPLAGVKITIEHTVWQGTYLYGETDNKGKYKITIPSEPAGDWTAKAQLKKTAYGQDYIFDLDGNTSAFNKSEGAIRNFTWKLTGKKPGTDTYYGAHVDLYQFGTDAQMDKIKIVFTPAADTLIDGSVALSFERTVEDVAGTFMVKDVPVGKYSIKAKYPGKKLLLDNRHDNGNAKASKPVIFGKYGNLAETEYNIEFWVSE